MFPCFHTSFALGEAYYVDGRYEEALQITTDAYNAAEKKLGWDHPEVLFIQGILGDFMVRIICCRRLSASAI